MFRLAITRPHPTCCGAQPRLINRFAARQHCALACNRPSVDNCKGKIRLAGPFEQIRKSGYRFALATNAGGVCAEVVLKQKDRAVTGFAATCCKKYCCKK